MDTIVLDLASQPGFVSAFLLSFEIPEMSISTHAMQIQVASSTDDLPLLATEPQNFESIPYANVCEGESVLDQIESSVSVW